MAEEKILLELHVKLWKKPCNTHTEIEKLRKENSGLYGYKINAGVRSEGLTYSRFINALSKSKIKLDRKVLAELAYNNPEVFKTIVKKVQSSLN